MSEIGMLAIAACAGFAVYVALVAMYDWTWRERGARIHRAER